MELIAIRKEKSNSRNDVVHSKMYEKKRRSRDQEDVCCWFRFASILRIRSVEPGPR